jgi:hypothetical protein
MPDATYLDNHLAAHIDVYIRLCAAYGLNELFTSGDARDTLAQDKSVDPSLRHLASTGLLYFHKNSTYSIRIAAEAELPAFTAGLMSFLIEVHQLIQRRRSQVAPRPTRPTLPSAASLVPSSTPDLVNEGVARITDDRWVTEEVEREAKRLDDFSGASYVARDGLPYLDHVQGHQTDAAKVAHDVLSRMRGINKTARQVDGVVISFSKNQHQEAYRRVAEEAVAMLTDQAYVESKDSWYRFTVTARVFERNTSGYVCRIYLAEGTTSESEHASAA